MGKQYQRSDREDKRKKKIKNNQIKHWTDGTQGTLNNLAETKGKEAA